MPQLTLNLSAQHLARLLDCFGDGWQATVNGAPNPETKPQFAKRRLREQLAATVQNYEAGAAKRAAISAMATPIVLTE